MSEQINTVDALMDLDPLSLTKDNIDSIIAYHRKARANVASGVKAKHDSGPKIDISEVMAKLTGQGEAKPAIGIRRR